MLCSATEETYICEIRGRQQLPAISCELKLMEEEDAEGNPELMYTPTNIELPKGDLPEFLT